MVKYSFCFLYMEKDETRKNNYNQVMRLLNNINYPKEEYEILVYEEPKTNLTFRKMEKKYNELINKAKGEWLILMSSDLVFDEEFLNKCDKYTNYSVFYPWDVFVIINGKDRPNITIYHPEEAEKELFLGCLCIKKDLFWNIGRFNEQFDGYGGSDNEFIVRLKKLGECPHMPNTIVHLYHDIEKPEERCLNATEIIEKVKEWGKH